MAASAAFTVDLRNGSVSRGNSNTTFTLLPLMTGVSATMPLSTRLFFVPAYITVASASMISLGYIVISFLLFQVVFEILGDTLV